MAGRKFPKEVEATGALTEGDRQDICLLWMLPTYFFLSNVIFDLQLLLLLSEGKHDFAL